MGWLEDLTGYLDSTDSKSNEDKKIAEDLKSQRNEQKNQEKQAYIDSVKDTLSSEPESEEEAKLKEELAEQFGIEGEASEEDLQAIEEFLEENYENLIPEEFLVRGAMLYCNCGTHERKLNVLKDHGVYTEGMPMIHELDRVNEENITFFGVCNSGSSLLKSENVLLKIKVEEEVKNKDGTISTVTREENVRGKKCELCIIGNWEDTKENVRIVDNGDKAPFDKFKSRKSSNKGYRAVTTKSFLVCKYGGIIEPLTSGQVMLEEE